jgi:hypothetical protein
MRETDRHGMHPADKRKNERVETVLAIQLERDGAIIEGTTVNASLGGVLVRARVEPEPHVGDRIGIALTLPTLAEPVRAQAEVRWIGRPPGKGENELGLQFATGLRARETWALGQWLERARKGQKLA